MLQQRAEDQTVTLIEPVITAEMTRATHRDDSRKRVVGLDALASDEDDAVDLGSTRGAKAAAAEAVLGKGTADGDSYYISRVGARVAQAVREGTASARSVKTGRSSCRPRPW
jgi:hypothetical protein